HTPLIIGGQPTSASDGETFEIRNPYSNEVVGTASSASSTDCKAAVDAAAEAFKTWEHTSPNERRDIFLKVAELVATDKYKQKIISTHEEETAAAPYWSFINWVPSANTLKTLAGSVNLLKAEIFPSGSIPGAQVIAQRRAMGVIFAISPWNAPFTLSLRAIAAPLLSGNTIVLKSSEYSPRSQAIVVELFLEAGLPPGVLNFISISRENAPALTSEIIAHPAVRKINFTGNDQVGKIIAMEAAKHLKPCVLELGGKAPVVVLNDANIELAAKSVAWGSMAHSGQVCMSTERVIVQSGIADKFISTVKDLVATLKSGNPTTDSNAKLGALFTESSAENVVSLIKKAKEAGAEVMLGDLSREGVVVQPHLVKGVKPGMDLWDKESFGPVAGFIIVETVDEAVKLANSSEYSLVSALWTSDVYTGQSIASRIRAGKCQLPSVCLRFFFPSLPCPLLCLFLSLLHVDFSNSISSTTFYNPASPYLYITL
ncbi:aldehyde dehydrogenase domain-containing protein, partial [Crucibulum laeve]